MHFGETWKVSFSQLVPHHHEMFPDATTPMPRFSRYCSPPSAQHGTRSTRHALLQDQPGRDTQALPPDLEQLQTTPEMLLLRKEKAWSVSLQTRKPSHGAPAAVSATTAARRRASSALSLHNTTLCDCTILGTAGEIQPALCTWSCSLLPSTRTEVTMGMDPERSSAHRGAEHLWSSSPKASLLTFAGSGDGQNHAELEVSCWTWK